MKIDTFVLTAFQQNTRILHCPETRKAICIDPGEPSEAIAAHIRKNELDLTHIFITHAHLDHIGGTAFLKTEFPLAQVTLHKDDEDLYAALRMQPIYMGFGSDQLAGLGMEYDDPPPVDRHVQGGESLSVGELEFEVRHCPGHTRGHIVLVNHASKKVFTGDCLFSGSIGRTDLPGGDSTTLLNSIRTQILSLDDDYGICCGHGPDTTVGKERATNPFLTGLYQIG